MYVHTYVEIHKRATYEADNQNILYENIFLSAGAPRKFLANKKQNSFGLLQMPLDQHFIYNDACVSSFIIRKYCKTCEYIYRETNWMNFFRLSSI